MGVLDFLGIGKTIAAPIDAVGNALSKIVTTDKDRLIADQALELLRQQPAILQVEINKLEAQSASNFKSGWRPAIGWICALCVALYFIPLFIIADYIWLHQYILTGQIIDYPIDSSQLMQIVYLMLGFGAYHTIENGMNQSRRK